MHESTKGAMDFYHFFGFAEILKESIKLVHKNEKLMALTTTLSLISSSIFFVSFFDLTSISFISDMLAKESLFPISSSITTEFTRKSQGTKENVPYFLTVFFGFILCYSIISFFSMMAAIVVSAESYNDNRLSIKELPSRILKSWTRPFLTAFYTTIFALGYAYSALFMATPRPVFSDISNLKNAVIFCVAAYIFYLYLSSVWILSLVVSVVEEDGGGGISALGKSAEMIKAHKIDAFLLNVVLNAICFAVYLCSNLMIKGGKFDKIDGLLLVNVFCLIRIFTFVAYTVLYFRGMELTIEGE